MTQEQARLPARLKALRLDGWPGLQVTQRQLGEALAVSVPTISSWEKEDGPALPGPDRLEAYARFFATRASVAQTPARLLADDQLTPEEEGRRLQLLDELTALRDEATGSPARQQPRSFWHFPDEQPIRVIGRRLPDYELKGVQYANPYHPNYIRSLLNADIDATIELVGHLRAENPGSEVRWTTSDLVTSTDLVGHLVVLGGGDEFLSTLDQTESGTSLSYLARRTQLPFLIRVPDGGDPEYDAAFVLTRDADGTPAYRGGTEEVFQPRYLIGEDGARLTKDGHPLLEYDVALIARLVNPLNVSATLTVCCGIFSRGVYGLVRAFTDAKLRQRNEEYLRVTFPGSFWMLTHVPVLPGDTVLPAVTPDFGRPFHQLASGHLE